MTLLFYYPVFTDIQRQLYGKVEELMAFCIDVFRVTAYTLYV